MNHDMTSQTVQSGGADLHYVRAGDGPVLVLIHGFPQDWSEYRAIMPRLAKRFTVIAVDLPGVGGSAPSGTGFDAATLAQHIRELVSALHLERVYVVGHDLGGMVAYAFARRYPEMTAGAMILDVALPGIAGWEKIEGHPAMWHVRFMQVPGLAEELVRDRQEQYFGYFFSFGRFSPSDVARYSNAYRSPAQLRAALEIYRAFPQNADFNRARREHMDVPIVLACGDGSPFAAAVPEMLEGLRASGCTKVTSDSIAGSVHYLADDQPDALATLIEEHVSF